MPRMLSEEEYNALVDKVLNSLPSGMDEANYNRVIGPAMEQALGVAENSPAPLIGSSMGRALSGVGQGLKSMGEGLYNTVTDPVGTIEGMITAHGDQFSKAGENLGQGRYFEAAGHGLAGLLPGIGPAAANIGEQIAETGDVASGVGQGAVLAGSVYAPKAGKAVARKAIKATSAAAAVPGQAMEAMGSPVGKIVRKHALRAVPGVRNMMDAAEEIRDLRAAQKAPTSPAAAAPVATPSPAGPPPAESPAVSPKMAPKVLNELAIQARRQGVKLSEQDYDVAVQAIQQGASPVEAVAAIKASGPMTPAKVRLTADETKQYLESRKRGKSDLESREAIVAARSLQRRHGLPTTRTVESRVKERNESGRWP